MPSASSGVIGRTCATVPSLSTTSASHSTGAPVDCAETRSIAPVSSLSSPPTMRTSCHAGLRDPGRWECWSHGVLRRGARAAAWSAATTPIGPCRVRSSSVASPTRSARPAPASARAGTSSSSRGRPSATRSGATTTTRGRPERQLAQRHTGMRRCSCCACRTRTPTSTAMPTHDKGWTDRDEASLAGALLGHRHGHGCLLILLTATDEGPRRPLLRGAAGAPRRSPRGLRHPLRPHHRRCRVHRVCRPGTEEPQPAAAPPARCRGRGPLGPIRHRLIRCATFPAWQVTARGRPARRWGVHPLAARSTTRHGPTHDHPASA